MAASLVPPPAARRPSRGSLLTVSIGSEESAEWALDEAFRSGMIRDFERRAREKGRKFFEIYGSGGERLHIGEVES